MDEIDKYWQMDLVDLSKLSKCNDGYKFFLVVIDMFSNLELLVPLKSKEGKESTEGLFKLNHKSKTSHALTG